MAWGTLLFSGLPYYDYADRFLQYQGFDEYSQSLVYFVFCTFS